MSGSDTQACMAPSGGCRAATDGAVRAEVDGHDGTAAGEAVLSVRLRAAEDKIAHLERALLTQRHIGIAIGLLAHRFDCSPENAWQVLVRLSQTTNVKVRDLAQVLADAHSGRIRPEDAEIAAAVAAQLPAHRLP